uniref:Uncharacterized protein n=1 Tax=Pseudellipsoidion edaphicum TaxID=1431838 RepID=A0A410D2X7_9STRA|nr:hypothetical protein Ycf95 [Pseudellipsoidion edaphicum]QAA12053.1 hypothetical protein Ycf95 [Pseudellipsoidion edaphicum]
MSHSVTMFNQFSLKNMVFMLINYSSQTNTKIRIRKNEILTKSFDSSGYQLNKQNRLTFIDNHKNVASNLNQKKFVTQYLQELKCIELKSHFKVEEVQRLKRSTKSRILSTRLTTFSV